MHVNMKIDIDMQWTETVTFLLSMVTGDSGVDPTGKRDSLCEASGAESGDESVFILYNFFSAFGFEY